LTTPGAVAAVSWSLRFGMVILSVGSELIKRVGIGSPGSL
jgi:hypothetical protein